MKKRNLCVMIAVLPLTVWAQVLKSEINDSTEYVMQPKTVVDTAQVEAIGRAYRDSHLAALKTQLGALMQERQTLKAITAIGEKEQLKAEDGTLTLYTALLEELKAGSQRSTDFVRNGYWRMPVSSMKTNLLGMPKGMNTTLEKELEKAEKQLTKKQRTYPAVVNYAAWLDKQHDEEQRQLQHDIAHLDGRDLFWAYADSMGNTDYPQREIQIRVKNADYRPAMFQPYYNSGKLDELDERIQKQGWEWMDNESYEDVTEAYPIPHKYMKYASHPEYKMIYSGYAGRCAYDKEGQLVFVPRLKRSDTYRIKQLLLNLAYRKDYADNKYNIKEKDKDVQYVIVNKLGLSGDNDAKMKAIMGKAYDSALKSEFGLYPQTMAEVDKNKAARQMMGQMFRMMNEDASNFLKQLELDHEGDYDYIYRIERVGPTAFCLHYVTKEGKPRCNVTVTYSGTEPYQCDWQIEDIVDL